MKKIVLVLFLLSGLSVFADDNVLIEEQSIQSRINNCAMKILNANKISRPVVFVYNDADKKTKLNLDTTLTKRQVVVYKYAYKHIEDENELAAFLSRRISIALRSFDGVFGGFLRSLQVSAAPKKFEIVADKRAVDFMVNAGYNPVALITYIQKTSPQRRFDAISNHNLTSKRLAVIYEYIYVKYPYYLKNNEYIDNENYQNFLLTSRDNRRLLQEKIMTGSGERLKYE